jgi:hypothetical protein
VSERRQGRGRRDGFCDVRFDAAPRWWLLGAGAGGGAGAGAAHCLGSGRLYCARCLSARVALPEWEDDPGAAAPVAVSADFLQAREETAPRNRLVPVTVGRLGGAAGGAGAAEGGAGGRRKAVVEAAAAEDESASDEEGPALAVLRAGRALAEAVGVTL